MKPPALCESRILELARGRDFFVDKYRYSHEALRKKCRRMLKDGKLQLMKADKNGFTYRTAEVTA
jgi:hypothetical protein